LNLFSKVKSASTCINIWQKKKKKPFIADNFNKWKESRMKNVVSESYGVWFSACHDTVEGRRENEMWWMCCVQLEWCKCAWFLPECRV